MERNSKSSSCPKDVCEKIYKAVNVSPAFQAIRRISSRPQYPSPSPSPAPNSSPLPPPLSKKNIDIQSQTYSPKKYRKSAEDAKRHDDISRNREAAEMVPVNFDFSKQSIPANKSATPPLPSINPKNSAQVASRIEPESKTPSMPVVQTPTQGNKANNRKFESPQHIKLEEAGSNKPGIHIEDRFTDYINRAKMKMRTLSKAGHEKQHAAASPAGKDKFTDYINRAKVKLRTTSSISGGKS